MADFAAIYEIEEVIIEEYLTITAPDPVVIRGAGNITVYVLRHWFIICNVIVFVWYFCLTITIQILSGLFILMYTVYITYLGL